MSRKPDDLDTFHAEEMKDPEYAAAYRAVQAAARPASDMAGSITYEEFLDMVTIAMPEAAPGHKWHAEDALYHFTTAARGVCAALLRLGVEVEQGAQHRLDGG